MKTIRSKLRSFIFAALLCLSILSSILTTTTSYAADVPSGWATSAVHEALNINIIPEGLDQNYQSPITRAEFAQTALYFCAAQYNLDPLTFVWEYRTSHAGPGETELPIDWDAFQDVSMTQSENIWPIYAAAFGLVEGRGNGIFDPEGAISRQEAAVMLLNTYRLYAGEHLQLDQASISFADTNSIAAWAVDAVEVMTSMGVMTGTGNNYFAPTETYTREQCYTTFMALYKNAPISKYHQNVEGLYSPEEYLDYLTEGRMTPFTLKEILSCDTAYIIYGSTMSFSSSDTQLIVVYRDGRGGHYGKGFSYPVSPTRTVGYELENFTFMEDDTLLTFTARPTEKTDDTTVSEYKNYTLDILSGDLEINYDA